MKKIQIPLCLTALLTVLCLLSGCAGEEAAPELLEPVDVAVQTTVVERGTVTDAAVYEAFTKPLTTTAAFMAEGTVSAVMVVRGDRVEAGDPLAVLDTQTLEEELESVQASLSAMERDYEGEKTALEIEILELEAQDDPSASARAALLRLQYEPEEQIRQQTIRELESRAEELTRSIQNAALTAPCSGTVLYSSVSEGDRVRPGASVIWLADDSSLSLVTDYLEDKVILNAQRIYAAVGGETYELEYLPYEREEYLQKKMAGEDLTSTFRLIDENGEAAAGMFSMLYIVAQEAEDTLYLPTTAVFHDTTGYYAYRIEDGVQTRTELEIGIRTDAQTQILSGLEEGDEVYVGS